ncbi:hypothetical protein H8356DRAFT_1268202 [Neocallimastix lanati (nom. inval.)]|jgi:hypothetical protein|uniref:Thc1 RRM domain-containing protein n=1 Tax=Neocallimastix californiae TaxID=1754190 RepID=A0A1Y2BNB2_9FUNG|nr:hypothetical protein H8356DRAFT_1268202 [Neocallimastix sp. JGI-2020a]ORY36243.1 hypothetical protein LY90DRAFT_673080 [Neocallimastix californiae]|eukprot:ORY36243.1 hypothetical protein LY90DRAFT_673080 [Neocallimastix californiae]
MSEKSSTSPSNTPSNNGQTVQKKKSFRHKKSSSNLNRNKKSNSNLKVRPLEQIETEKQKNSDKIQKTQVNKENNDNKKPEIEKKEVEKKKNRYKKSMTDLKKDDKSDTVSEAKSDVTSSTNEKKELRKSASKQLKKRKSKAVIKEKVKTEEQKEEDNADIKLIDSFLTVLSKKRDEMEKEEEIENNPPPQQTKYTPKRPSFSKANKPKKEIPVYDDVEIRKVLDCYDFPTSFKTHNLLEIFPEFKGKFRINWINDSRALFIFENEDLARAALLNKIDETRYIIKPYENPNSDSSTSYSLNDPKISAINILKNIL